ncbi:uncharacterized protein E0L32_011169 [Thyridium curvatum]|uniref:Rhodopsin domain-containing protein n=1 Tax=Thyridium curvatum TaxID=1093900 RepID=A0A507AD96_9PEZI|nr:uncharacterized protein E0L32_011169 [Thyridium curvatum]TPX06945.1 hypothetical protein E0L32_011169 [Thyridium curvatum]
MASVDLSQYNGGSLIGVASTFLVLTWVSVFLRFYVRTQLTNGFQSDDWFMLVAQANFTLSCAFILQGVKSGIGRHNKALDQASEIDALKWQALATATYITNMMFIKLSIALFLLRLATAKRYKWILWVSMSIIAIWSLVAFFWDVFQCNPVEAQWDFTIPNQTCVTPDQIVSAAYALSVMTILSDWLYALLPIAMIWGVQMTKQAKITVSIVLGLGIFASIATLIRLKFLSDLNDTADILFQGTDAMVWTLIEPGVAIVAASLVTIRPLLRKLRLPGFTSHEGKSGPTYGRSGGGRPGAGYANNNNINMNNNKRHSAFRPPGAMPGFGPGDLTLIDLETGDTAAPPPGRADREPTHKFYLERSLAPSSAPAAVGNKTEAQKQQQTTTRERAVGLSPEDVLDASAPHKTQRGLTIAEDSGSEASVLSGEGQKTGRSEVFIIEGPRESGRRTSIHTEDLDGHDDGSQIDGRGRHEARKKKECDPFADEGGH